MSWHSNCKQKETHTSVAECEITQKRATVFRHCLATNSGQNSDAKFSYEKLCKTRQVSDENTGTRHRSLTANRKSQI